MTTSSDTGPSGPGSSDTDTGRSEVVEVFWRPGCPYCAALRRTLHRRGVAATWRNIWTDEEARALVRAANAGNETVPTVGIGECTLTNPGWGELAPLLGHGALARRPLRRARVRLLWTASWLALLALVLLSVTLDRAGDGGMSWAVDGLAVLVWWLTRPLRR